MSFQIRIWTIVTTLLALLLAGCPSRDLAVSPVGGEGDTSVNSPLEFPELDIRSSAGSGEQDGTTDFGDTFEQDASGSDEEDIQGTDSSENVDTEEDTSDENDGSEEDALDTEDVEEDVFVDPCPDIEVCEDDNPCTEDSFDEVACACVFTPTPGEPCDDESACTETDLCNETGECAGTDVICNDENACTVDICSPAEGCVFTPSEVACDDGDACTQEDMCTDGTCMGAAVVCDDGEACTDDSCDPATGCLFTDNEAPCEDGDPCTGNDSCVEGSCVSGAVLECGEEVPCSLTSCEGGEPFIWLATPQAPDLEDVALNGAIQPGEILAEDLIFPFQCSALEFTSDLGYLVTRDPDASKAITWDDMTVQVTYPSPTTVEVTLIASWVTVPLALNLSSIVCNGTPGVGPASLNTVGTTTMNQLSITSAFEWQQDNDGTWFPIVQTQSQNAVNVELNANCSGFQQVCDTVEGTFTESVVNALATYMQDAIPPTLKSKLGANKCPEDSPCASNHCGNSVCEPMSPVCMP